MSKSCSSTNIQPFFSLSPKLVFLFFSDIFLCAPYTTPPECREYKFYFNFIFSAFSFVSHHTSPPHALTWIRFVSHINFKRKSFIGSAQLKWTVSDAYGLSVCFLARQMKTHRRGKASRRRIEREREKTCQKEASFPYYVFIFIHHKICGHLSAFAIKFVRLGFCVAWLVAEHR